jgi:hypothetical protein
MCTLASERKLDKALMKECGIPRPPWGSERTAVNGEPEYGLNEAGQQAFTIILLCHDEYLDVEAVNRLFDQDPRSAFLALEKGADKFIDDHQDYSCVAGLEPDHLRLLMLLFKIWCHGQSVFFGSQQCH